MRRGLRRRLRRLPHSRTPLVRQRFQRAAARERVWAWGRGRPKEGDGPPADAARPEPPDTEA